MSKEESRARCVLHNFQSTASVDTQLKAARQAAFREDDGAVGNERLDDGMKIICKTNKVSRFSLNLQ